MQLILAMMCAALAAVSAAQENWLLMAYWQMVLLYWIMNWMKGKRRQ